MFLKAKVCDPAREPKFECIGGPFRSLRFEG